MECAPSTFHKLTRTPFGQANARNGIRNWSGERKRSPEKEERQTENKSRVSCERSGKTAFKCLNSVGYLRPLQKCFHVTKMFSTEEVLFTGFSLIEVHPSTRGTSMNPGHRLLSLTVCLNLWKISCLMTQVPV